VQSIKYSSDLVEGTPGGKGPLVFIRNASRIFYVLGLEALFATSLIAQTIAPAVRVPATPSLGGSVHLNQQGANRLLGVSGLPAGPSQLPYPLTSTPANDAWVRNHAWATYNESLRQIPTTTNPNRLAKQQNLLDQNRFIQKPQSSHRYNFQFSDNEIRSVQGALRRLGIYSGQVDGILGPDTQRAIEDYQVRTKRPVTGQPDQSLNASLGIF
jgi:hypothetical protein